MSGDLLPEHEEQIVAVVRGDEGRSAYVLHREALARLLLHPDVADRPMALVGLAGGCRSGKSFMLDYFLRYLRADARAQENGAWLGAPDAPLEGFTWSGGAGRVTTGLRLWSRPLHAGAGDARVPVVLMDTQGTFDMLGTMRDCSTIFALSTLLASVQIYNLKEDIREDSLQHLQLFTSHGRAAMELNTGQKPYQTLKFLIRDWAWDYEHAFGAEGGASLLALRLGEENAVGELREVRQHIRTSFERVECHLLPHPGRAAQAWGFDGRHEGVTPEFKEQLLQFVPSVFDAKNLLPKRINGAQVTGRQLIAYIDAYIDVFNNGDMPEIMSIMQATSKAAVQTAAEGAVQQYDAAMEAVGGARQTGRAVAALRAHHRAASAGALAAFRAARTMADPQHLIDREAQLAKTLEERLRTYEQTNESKHYKAIARGQKAYEDVFKSETRTEMLCLNPLDLVDLHHRASTAAVKLFDEEWITPEGFTDDEKAAFVSSLEERLRDATRLNEVNNHTGVVEARETYTSWMSRLCRDPPCMHGHLLRLIHEDALKTALDVFQSKRNRTTQHAQDPYQAELCHQIVERFDRLQSLNAKSNNSAVKEAVDTYHKSIRAMSGQQAMTQKQLNQIHEDALELALNVLDSKRRLDKKVDEADEYRERIVKEIVSIYVETSESNDMRAGLTAYAEGMEHRCKVGLPWLSHKLLRSVHELALAQALKVFHENRMSRLYGNSESETSQRAILTQKIKEKYTDYMQVNKYKERRRQRWYKHLCCGCTD